MIKKYAGLILTAMISSLLGCAAFFYVVVPWVIQPAVDTENASLQEPVLTVTEPATIPETVQEETVPETIPETEPTPTIPIREDVDLDIVTWVSPSISQGYMCTWEQAVDLIKLRYPVLNVGGFDDGWFNPFDDKSAGYGMIEYDARIAGRFPDSDLARSFVSSSVAYLLRDNMEIYNCLVFWHDREPYDGLCPPMSINCIKTAYGYEFRDPAINMKHFPDTEPELVLPEAKVKTLEEYFEILESDPDLAELVDAFYILPHGCTFEFNWDSEGVVTAATDIQWFIPETPAIPWPVTAPREVTAGIVPLWGNVTEGKEDTLHRPLTVASGWLPHENVYNIEQFDLYNHLGGITMTPEETIKLVIEEPEVVKEKVKTAADVLLYMMAVKIIEGTGCYCTDWDGDIWHWNMSAKEIMHYREGNCGSCANLANYLLEDDYEEVGFIDHAYRPGGGGSHVYNYILHEGKYYVVDFSWYMFGNYTLDLTYPIPVLDSLEEWPARIKKSPYNGYYPAVNTIISYTSPGRQLPCVFGDAEYFDENEKERVKVFPASVADYSIPEGAVYTVLYQDKTGYKIAEKPFNREIYDWTLLDGGTPADKS